MTELVARVRAAARRGVARERRRARRRRSSSRSCSIDPRNVQAYVDGVSVGLTPTEFRLLYALALERGQVVTRDELMQRIWGRRNRYRDRTVDVFVRKLRDKIDRRASRHTFIQTRYGVGYKLEPVSKALGASRSVASPLRNPTRISVRHHRCRYGNDFLTARHRRPRRRAERLFNRELSWLDFNARVLELAADATCRCSSG